MLKKMVIAFDGSEQSREAFHFGLDMALKYSASVTVLAIIRLPEPPVSVEMQAIMDKAKEYFETEFLRLKEEISGKGIACGFEIRTGHPAEQIVAFADENNSDVIVMGHRGKSLLQKWLVGSVAKRVLSYATCTVIVVR